MIDLPVSFSQKEVEAFHMNLNQLKFLYEVLLNQNERKIWSLQPGHLRMHVATCFNVCSKYLLFHIG